MISSSREEPTWNKLVLYDIFSRFHSQASYIEWKFTCILGKVGSPSRALRRFFTLENIHKFKLEIMNYGRRKSKRKIPDIHTHSKWKFIDFFYFISFWFSFRFLLQFSTQNVLLSFSNFSSFFSLLGYFIFFVLHSLVKVLILPCLFVYSMILWWFRSFISLASLLSVATSANDPAFQPKARKILVFFIHSFFRF